MTSALEELKAVGRLLTCLRCGHEWHARVGGRDPSGCPAHCQFQHWWNTPYDLLPKHVKAKIMKAKKK